jgi:hypothetical protein
VEQLRAHLAKFKGTKDEGEWIGLEKWLGQRTADGGPKTITRDEVRQFVEANRVDVPTHRLRALRRIGEE